jgi:hypothetical protein
VATTAGVAWSQQVRPDRDLGLLVGYELAVHGQQGVDSGPGFRVLGSVGFTDPPESRAEPPVAHEAVLRLGYAGFTDRGGFVHAFVVGPRFALPIEVAAATQPRAGALPFTTAWQLVPEVGGSVALSPYHSPRLDGGLGLSVRLQLDAARPR